MIPKDCKRLAEVDFPIAVVSKHAVREKSGPKGHISTLHLWWARRPLASSRAVLLALLWPDPCDPLCPTEFREQARKLLPQVGGCNPGTTDEDLRKALLKFIADFANWDNAAQRTYLDVSRALVKAAHGEEAPLVVDPFAGGGSIPLESLRLGCETFASDLNPVACLILKVMLEDIPRHGPKLAEDLRRVGAEIKRQAEKELADLYPKDPDGATPIAYLWARTVRCESPNCGAEIPVFKSGWLSMKGAKKASYLREAVDGQSVALVVESNPTGGPVTLRIVHGHGSKDPGPGYVVIEGTKARGNNANVICCCCGGVLPGNKKNPRTVSQLAAQRGGADVVFDEKGRRTGGARLLAVVTLRPGERGRHYRLPAERDYEAVRKAQKRLAAILGEWEQGGKQGLCPVPDEPLPPVGTLGFRVQRYGMLEWGDLFAARQKVALRTWIPLLIQETGGSSPAAGGFALALSRMAMCGMSLTNWNAFAEKMQHTFGRQALPIVWDFAEVVPLVHAPGAWENACDLVAEVADVWPGSSSGQSELADAAEHPLPDQTATVWFTDPPYYNAVPYADLSDFFFVWLKRALPNHALLRDPFDATNLLTPKLREAVQDETKQNDGQPKDRMWFEQAMARAFAEGQRVLREDGVGCVVFAHKTTEGWEALLSGMIRGGWTITGSWPIATEMGSRLRARESAALATSVHLVCRPRPRDAPVGDWAGVLRELPNRVGDWMERLQGEGVRGADLVFACIGPALEIYSRYSKVVDPQEREIPLGGNPEAAEPYTRGYLAYVWETVGRIALEQILGTSEARARNGAAGALEEDARLTALFLWTLQSTNGQNGTAADPGEDAEDDAGEEDEGSAPRGKAKGFSLVFDVVRRFAQPLGINLPLWENRIVTTEKGVVRLLPVSERARQLFGDDGVGSAADWIEDDPVNHLQLALFPEMEQDQAPRIRGRGRRKVTIDPSAVDGESMRKATTLDRVHAAMLLQAGGQANALRALIGAEQDRGPDFLRLSNALSALYPKESEEKRLLDAMLLAVPR
jgi:adenine-specific DNA methylase